MLVRLGILKQHETFFDREIALSLDSVIVRRKCLASTGIRLTSLQYRPLKAR